MAKFLPFKAHNLNQKFGYNCPNCKEIVDFRIFNKSNYFVEQGRAGSDNVTVSMCMNNDCNAVMAGFSFGENDAMRGAVLISYVTPVVLDRFKGIKTKESISVKLFGERCSSCKNEDDFKEIYIIDYNAKIDTDKALLNVLDYCTRCNYFTILNVVGERVFFPKTVNRLSWGFMKQFLSLEKILV